MTLMRGADPFQFDPVRQIPNSLSTDASIAVRRAPKNVAQALRTKVKVLNTTAGFKGRTPWKHVPPHSISRCELPLSSLRLNNKSPRESDVIAAEESPTPT